MIDMGETPKTDCLSFGQRMHWEQHLENSERAKIVAIETITNLDSNQDLLEYWEERLKIARIANLMAKRVLGIMGAEGPTQIPTEEK
jgi:hypothetical protein